VQLEARELDGNDLRRLRVQHGLEQRRPDVAGLDGVPPRRPQHRAEHRDRRRLAVRAGHRQPGRGAGRRAHPPGQLDLAPDRDPGRGGRRQHRLVRPPAGRGDDDVRRRAADVRQRRRVVLAEADVDAEDVEHLAALLLARPVAAVEQDHPRAALDQRVGRGEPGHADAGDDDPQPGPVRVPVRQLREEPGHVPTTHSA
jgi:hypothetical protein